MKRLLLVVLIVGCGKQSGELSQAEANYAGQALAAGVEDNAAAYGTVMSGVGVDGTCVTATGDTTDSDGDSVPNNAMLTFNCTSVAFGLTGMLTGTERVVDTQVSVVAWDFSITADLHATLTNTAGASITQDRNGTLVASQSSAVGPFSLDRTLDATTVFKGDRGNTLATVDENNEWTMTYTPQASWTPGGVVLTGSLSVSGMWSVTVNGATADATLSTATPLTLTPTCASRVTAGSLVATFPHGVITVLWSGCGTSTVSFVAK